MDPTMLTSGPSNEKHFSFSFKSIFVFKTLYLVIHSYQYLFTHLTIFLAFSAETFRHCSTVPHTRVRIFFHRFNREKKMNKIADSRFFGTVYRLRNRIFWQVCVT